MANHRTGSTEVRANDSTVGIWVLRNGSTVVYERHRPSVDSAVYLVSIYLGKNAACVHACTKVATMPSPRHSQTGLSVRGFLRTRAQSVSLSFILIAHPS